MNKIKNIIIYASSIAILGASIGYTISNIKKNNTNVKKYKRHYTKININNN